MSRNTDLLSIIDFGDADVFEGTIAYPTIVTAERRVGEPAPSRTFRALNWTDPGEDADEECFSAYLANAGFDMPQLALERTGWQIEPTVNRDLLARIRDAGPTLKEFVDNEFYYGVKTGFNEAFVINSATRAKLIQDQRSEEIIKPFLRGRDIKRWRVEPQDCWLIFTRRGISIELYPAVKSNLEGLRELLEPKPVAWRATAAQPIWPGRKAGSYK